MAAPHVGTRLHAVRETLDLEGAPGEGGADFVMPVLGRATWHRDRKVVA